MISKLAVFSALLVAVNCGHIGGGFGGQSYSGSNLAAYNSISHGVAGLGQGFGGGQLAGHGLAGGGGLALVGAGLGHGGFVGGGAGAYGHGDVHDNEKVREVDLYLKFFAFGNTICSEHLNLVVFLVVFSLLISFCSPLLPIVKIILLNYKISSLFFD